MSMHHTDKFLGWAIPSLKSWVLHWYVGGVWKGRWLNECLKTLTDVGERDVLVLTVDLQFDRLGHRLRTEPIVGETCVHSTLKVFFYIWPSLPGFELVLVNIAVFFCECETVNPYHMSCDFVDGEDASIALQSLVVALSFPLHSWLGASALHPAIDRDEDANDHED